MKQAAPNVCVDPSDPKGTQVAGLVEKLRKQYKLNASIFGVWKGDGELVTGADGEALPGVPATRDFHFRICNVTETMTTTLLLQYVDDGKLSLADPVSKWFPSLPRSEQVTLGMLSSSTSGIVDYVTTKSFVDEYHRDPFQQFQPMQLIELGTSQKPLFAPGTSWAFSDTNFMLLGEILKKAGGEAARGSVAREDPRPARSRQHRNAADSAGPLSDTARIHARARRLPGLDVLEPELGDQHREHDFHSRRPRQVGTGSRDRVAALGEVT